MPGIYGACCRGSGDAFVAGMGKMCQAMQQSERHKMCQSVGEDQRFGFGRVYLPILNDVAQPMHDPDCDVTIVFHGELYNNPRPVSDPEYALKKYCECGDSFVSELSGIFHFAIHDARNMQVKLFSDKFGLQPLYYTLLEQSIWFAGEVKALLQAPGMTRTIDDKSVADFLHYGQVLGDKTLFTEVKLLKPGAVLTYDIRAGSSAVDEYWRLESLFGEPDESVSMDDVTLQLVESIRNRSRNTEQLGLSLSGGLDSRGILAGMGIDAEGINTYTLGLPGCADQKLASAMSRAAKTVHEFVPLDQSHLKDYKNMAQQMVWLSDGFYHPHESTEVRALEYFMGADFKILLRGHGGEVAKAAMAYPVMVYPEVRSFAKGKSVLDYIFNSANLVGRGTKAGKLFTPDFYNRTKDSALESLQTSCGHVVNDLTPPDVCLYYYVREHIRRQVVPSLEIFRTCIEVRMPYVDEDFMRVLFKLPLNQRLRGEVHHCLVRKHMPELMKVPDANTGAPLDASALRLFIADKINVAMKRVSFMGFRHYTEFQSWYRASFKNHMEEILFSKELAERGVFDMDELRQIVDLHLAGKSDFAHLLGTTVGLELSLRSFKDNCN